MIRDQFPAFFPFPVTSECLAALNDPSRTLLGPVQKERFKRALQESTARFKFIANQVSLQNLYALPYDNWEGYAAERREILHFIRDNGIRNVVFLTTDLHENVMNEVFIDLFTDPQPIAYELITGPIATQTAQEVLGPVAPLYQLLLSLVGVDCRHLDAYSYGLVEVDAASGTARIALKNDAGQTLTDQLDSSVACVKTFGP